MITTTAPKLPTGHDALLSRVGMAVSLGTTRRIRTMRQWAEEEVTLVDGPFEGRPFRVRRQPYSEHWFDLVEDPWWTECVATGPSQSGKTLCCFVIPCLYHLFERRETVICAVPDRDMVSDKWNQDLLPVLERTQYRELLPKMGAGSRGGDITAVRFHNGVTLRFMTAGGSDKSVAGFTAPVIVMTETDGFDKRISTSDEANKIEQIEARMRAFDLDRRRIYKECTLSTKDGHTWQRIQGGTKSQILLKCPHCAGHVLPEREDFHGWQEAATDADAAELASFHCPACGEQWTEDQREQANRDSVIVHDGQGISPSGTVSGTPKRTRCLGFRWSAVHNMIVPAAGIGLDEWKAARSHDEDNEERKLCQFVWAVPYQPKDAEDIQISVEQVEKQQSQYGKGQIPPGMQWVTVGVDVNLGFLTWVAIAWCADGTGHVIDYGTTGVITEDRKKMTEAIIEADPTGKVFDTAIVKALAHLRDKIGTGWVKLKPDGGADAWDESMYHRVHVDIRYKPEQVCEAIRRLKDAKWRPFIGQGLGFKNYTHPRATGRAATSAQMIGEQWYEAVLEQHSMLVMYANSNHWKSWLQRRMVLPKSDDRPTQGAITLYASTRGGEHTDFAKHITSERERTEFKPDKGLVTVFESIRAQNHKLDAAYMACVAGARCGFRTDADAKGSRMNNKATNRRGSTRRISPQPSGTSSFHSGSFRQGMFRE